MTVKFNHFIAKIANGQTESQAWENMGNGPASALVGIQMPAAWTAANLTFKASYDGVNYFDLYDKDGVLVTVTAAASRYIGLIPSLFAGIRHLKVVSTVAQGADRDIVLVAREI